MTALLYGWIYACLLVALAACIARAVRYARSPLHLRWELYPVPHEEARRAAYGGSRHEETDWWTRPARSNRLGELKAMGCEILFLKGVWEFNRKLWFCSYPFHLGLYLLIATGVAAAAAAMFPALDPWMHPLYKLAGLAGAALVLAGAGGLLVRRLKDPRLRNYTTAGDVFNLCCFIGAMVALLFAHGSRVPGTPGVAAMIRGLLTFDTSIRLSAPQEAGMAIAAALILYIPLTHMAHFIAKYFTYHAVRWDDKPNRNERDLAVKIAEYLAYRPTWSARHVGADGKATWAEVATKNPAAGARE